MPRPPVVGEPCAPPRYGGLVAGADDHVDDLVDFIQACPSSYHTATEVARRVSEVGFATQAETDAWDSSPGGHILVREGAVVAWRIPDGADGLAPFRMIGCHTDSPGVEIYGGPLLNSWLDRELGVAGRLVTEGGVRLVQSGPIARIPQLALHLDRAVNDDGLKLDKQRHTAPLWAAGDQTASVLDHLTALVGITSGEVLAFDLTIFDTAAPVILGASAEFLSSRRLDNLVSVHAGLMALINVTAGSAIPLLAAFDHEEIGSGSRSGASGPLLADVVGRISRSLGGDDDQRARSLASSACLSADTGHAVHPNYPERHDPVHRPVLNGGPLVKINSNQRYATGAQGASLWRRACRRAGVASQEFVSHNTVPCGSTIGPLTATRLGVQTVDVGIPLLSMHSARELAGVADPPALAQAMEAFLALEYTP